jgi:hypothetical protein
MRRIAMSVVGFVTVASLALSVAPSAFAERVLSPDGDASTVASTHHSGLAAWQISLVVTAAAVLLVALGAAGVWLSRRGRRTRLRTAV